MSPGQFEIDLGDGYRILERDSVAINGMQVYRTPIANGPFVLMLPHGIAAMCEDGRTVFQYKTLDECRDECKTLKELLTESPSQQLQKMTGVELISVERERQMSQEGWTPQHDDQHSHGELALAGATYALPRLLRAPYPQAGLPDLWPFDDGWKPSPNDRVRELVKAGALIAAEIDRLQRNPL